MQKQAEAGFEVYAFVLENSEVHKILAQIPAIRCIFGKPNTRFHWQNIRHLRKVLKAYQIPLLHSHNNIDVWTASIANYDKICKHFYSTYIMIGAKKKLPHYYFIYGNLEAAISTSLITNEAMAQNLAVSADKIRLVRYGVETEKFISDFQRREQVRRLWGISENQIVIGTLARITRFKNVRELAQAFLYIEQKFQQKVVIWLIGEPSIAYSDEKTTIYVPEDLAIEQEIQEFIQNNNLQNHVFRIPFQKDYIAFLDAMDIFVLASFDEMYSLSMIEAMLMQKPVIGLRSGGTPEQIGENERGLLIEQATPQAIAKAINTYLENPDLMKQKAENARAWALREHNWQNTLAEYAKIYGV
jgi:glycosyltransferase involved in cell wall biosynthesis